MKKYFLFILFCLVCLALITLKLYRSERLRLWWNTPLYLYDGRHTITANSSGIDFRTPGEVRVSPPLSQSNAAIRLIPSGGIDLAGEQSVSFSAARAGKRMQYRLRPQLPENARDDLISRTHFPTQETWRLYFEQRDYNATHLIAYYKDAAYGPGGLFFTDPRTGAHIAHDNYSTLYVPSPEDNSHAGPNEWLWAAAANRAFVESRMTGTLARAYWDARYCRRVKVPAHSHSPGTPGDIAWNEQYFYFYVNKTTGWKRVQFTDDTW